MRVAIAINGEGKGHVTRMIALARRLPGRVEPIFWAPETVAPMVRGAFPDHRVLPLPFLKIVLNREKVDLLKTGLENFDTFFGGPVLVRQLTDQMRLLKIEAVLSDFEPYSTKAARQIGLPVLQLNHPGIVLRHLSLRGDAILSRLIAATMMGSYDSAVISSFYHGDVGPILRSEVVQAERRRGDHVVVYLRPSMEEAVMEVLRRKRRRGLRELRIFPSRDYDFVESLASCRAVITNSGHQLSSEALHLGKPILSIPMEGQFEQRLNAKMIEATGRGMRGRLENMEAEVDLFFARLEEMEAAARGPVPEGYCFEDSSAAAAGQVASFFGLGAGAAGTALSRHA